MAKVYHNIIIALYDLICVVLGISVRLGRKFRDVLIIRIVLRAD